METKHNNTYRFYDYGPIFVVVCDKEDGKKDERKDKIGTKEEIRVG